MSTFKGSTSQLTAGSRPPMAPSASRAACGDVQARQVHPPSIPSNLSRDADQDVIFNSIGFYSDLLARLDTQIAATEEVYVASQMRVSEAQETPQSFI